MHIHIPNKNALVIPPNSCPIAKIPEDINIAPIIPILIFNLLNKTPLNINSSRIGANIIEEITSKRKVNESIYSGVKSKIGSMSGYNEVEITSKLEKKATTMNANKMFIKNI